MTPPHLPIKHIPESVGTKKRRPQNIFKEHISDEDLVKRTFLMKIMFHRLIAKGKQVNSLQRKLVKNLNFDVESE